MTTSHTAPLEQRGHGEDGVALFYALLVAIIVAGIVAVTFATALSEQQQSAFELDFEDTLHVAEAGAEVGLQAVQVDGTATNASDPAAFPGTEAEWAIAEASDLSLFTPTRIGEGEAVWLRPSTGATEFVYGVGFTPSRDAFLAGAGESFVRVVRMEVGFTDQFTPGLYAFLSDRVLTFNGGGSSSVLGSNGSVHTNGSFDPPSSSNFSFSGSVTFHECSTANCAGAGYTETDTVVPINAGPPEAIYATQTARDYLSDGGDWYDYCGGQWFKRVAGDDEVPCSGGDAVLQSGGVPGFSGTTQQSSGASGVYWFEGDTDVQMSSASVTMTIITGGDINLPNGNVSFDWLAAYDGVHAYAGGDVDWGNVDVNTSSISCAGGLSPAEQAAAASIPAGIVYAGNNILMGGNPSAAQISFIAENDVIFNGGGNRCIVLETDASGDLGGPGLPVVVQWDELLS